jgi:hypothetical protein
MGFTRIILFPAGGMSFFSPRTGFVCDTVKRFEVMLHLDHSDNLVILIPVPGCPSVWPNRAS